MPSYDLGDGVNLRYLAKDRDGNPVDATVALTITNLATGATVATPTVTRTALGQYDAATWPAVATGEFGWVFVASGAITDVAMGTFTVANPGPAVYADLTSVKSNLGKVTSDDRDENISLAIVAASRMIDASTGRWPGAFRPDRVATARTFALAGRIIDPQGYRRPQGGYLRSMLMVDDISTLTDLAVEIGNGAGGVYNSITSLNYGPDNALVKGLPIEWIGVPYTALLGTVDTVRVTARWGWPSVPSEVEMATRLLASRLYKRKDSPQGVIASADWGAVRVSRTDPDVYALIQHLTSPGFA